MNAVPAVQQRSGSTHVLWRALNIFSMFVPYQWDYAFIGSWKGASRLWRVFILLKEFTNSSWLHALLDMPVRQLSRRSCHVTDQSNLRRPSSPRWSAKYNSSQTGDRHRDDEHDGSPARCPSEYLRSERNRILRLTLWMTAAINRADWCIAWSVENLVRERF